MSKKEHKAEQPEESTLDNVRQKIDALDAKIQSLIKEVNLYLLYYDI